MKQYGIIRDPQPNDVIVITVPPNTTLEHIEAIGEATKAELGCQVVVVSEGVRVGDDGAAAELTALKARRCDGCRHGGEVNAFEVLCRIFNAWMPFDHACNAWQPKNP